MKTKKAEKVALPLGVLASDCEWPKVEKQLRYSELTEMGLQSHSLQFYRTEKLGWVLCTLHISNPSRRQAAGTVARTYAIGVNDSKIYTVGRGPHVLQELTVYLNKENIERLSKYVELWKKGMADAGQIRDRISSRRAQGQLYRAAGRTSWMW